MINKHMLEEMSLNEMLTKYPFVEDHLTDNLIDFHGHEDMSIITLLSNYDEDTLEEKAIDVDGIINGLIEYLNQMIAFLGIEENTIREISILAGYNKLGEKEAFGELVVKPGEIIAIVGPTGSGKSRLLADIEWGARADTPTKRTVLINGKPLEIKERFSARNKLVAQLSQNMNFVMDLTVEEFLSLHARSRMVEEEAEVIHKIFEKANDLAGERFKLSTPITSLSGGQSRALMIADTAILSTSPIVLIDEIENAGIDRKRALDLLIGEDKIVLMATHDPILALMGDRRIVINNGGVYKIMDVTTEEKAILKDLEKLDAVIQGMRSKLRYGKTLTLDY